MGDAKETMKKLLGPASVYDPFLKIVDALLQEMKGRNSLLCFVVYLIRLFKGY